MLAPIASRRAVALLSAKSEPETAAPRSSMTWANPLMPAPPMPMKCAFCCDTTASPSSSRVTYESTAQSITFYAYPKTPVLACTLAGAERPGRFPDELGDAHGRVGPAQPAGGAGHT